MRQVWIVSFVLALLTGPYVLSACLAVAETTGLNRHKGSGTDIEVDLQLILAVDVSASIDLLEARLQRRGYMNALLDPLVHQAIQSGPQGRIAVTYTEWAGPLTQRTVVDWLVIDGAASAANFVELLDQASILGGQRTSISNAILHAIPLFRNNGFRSQRKVIDISGDGPNNGGFYVHRTRTRAFDEGITINGLPILNGRPSPLGIPTIPDLDLYYEDCVIGGPGAFIVVAENLRSFAAAIRRKLIIEIAEITPFRQKVNQSLGFVPAQLNLGLTDCTIGEKQFELFRKRKGKKR